MNTPEIITPKIGMRFLHSRWLDPTKMPERVPALFQVTGFRHGAVYYAPVTIYCTGREVVHKSREYVDINKFHTVCLEVK